MLHDLPAASSDHLAHPPHDGPIQLCIPWQRVPRIAAALTILADIDAGKLTETERIRCFDVVDCIVSRDLAAYPTHVRIAATATLKGEIS